MGRTTVRERSRSFPLLHSNAYIYFPWFINNELLTFVVFRMGYYEVRIILAKVLWNFDLTLIPKDGGELDNWDHLENYQTYVKLPLWVTCTPVRG
jgi:hypothetical protein